MVASFNRDYVRRIQQEFSKSLVVTDAHFGGKLEEFREEWAAFLRDLENWAGNTVNGYGLKRYDSGERFYRLALTNSFERAVSFRRGILPSPENEVASVSCKRTIDSRVACHCLFGGEFISNVRSGLHIQVQTELERVAPYAIGAKNAMQKQTTTTSVQCTTGRTSGGLSPDPAGVAFSDLSNPQSWNLYSYVQNNPLSYSICGYCTF